MRKLMMLAGVMAVLHGVVIAQAPKFQPAAQPGNPPPQSGDVKAGVVALSGENHIINLSTSGKEPNSTKISFWRVVYSPVGPGHVCFVTADLTGNGLSKDDVRMAYTDNAELESYLAAAIMPVLDSSFYGEPMRWTHATFSRTGDTMTAWKEIIKADQTTIELVWRDFLAPFEIDKPLGDPKLPYGITSMFLPSRSADVLINGVRVAGSAYPRLRGTTPSSSAFLAFSETWLK